MVGANGRRRQRRWRAQIAVVGIAALSAGLTGCGSSADPSVEVTTASAATAQEIATLPTISFAEVLGDSIRRTGERTVQVRESGVEREVELPDLEQPMQWVAGVLDHGWLIVTRGASVDGQQPGDAGAYWLPRGGTTAVEIIVPASDPDNLVVRTVDGATVTSAGPAVRYHEIDFDSPDRVPGTHDWWLVGIEDATPTLLASGVPEENYATTSDVFTPAGHAWIVSSEPPSVVSRSWAAPLDLPEADAGELINDHEIALSFATVPDDPVGGFLLRVQIMDVISGKVREAASARILGTPSASGESFTTTHALFRVTHDSTEHLLAMDLSDGTAMLVTGDRNWVPALP